MKSIWNGSISFGLVNIPVKLYSAIEHKSFSMKLLHKKKLSPITYKKWCDDCNEEVDWNDIVRGVEVGKDRYVVLTKDELESIKPEKTKTIEIKEFVDADEIDSIYYDKHYYVGSERPKEKTYFLFKKALEDLSKVAIGKFVMREKEYVCAISPFKEGMLLSTLNYSYEIRDMNDIDNLQEKPKLSQEELELADELIEKNSKKSFKIADFKDTFAEKLNEMVQKKIEGEAITIERKEEQPETKEENLVEALKASLK